MGNTRIKNLMGEHGGTYITAAADVPEPAYPVAGGWIAGLCITDVVISAIVQPDFDESDELLSKTLASGFVIYGLTTSITVDSGTIQMFNIDSPSRFKEMSV